MSNKILSIKQSWSEMLHSFYYSLVEAIRKMWFKLTIILLLIILMIQKDLSLQLNLSSASAISQETENTVPLIQKPAPVAQKANMSMGTELIEKITPRTSTNTMTKPQRSDNLSNTYSNMTYHPKPKKVLSNAQRQKLKKQKAYVQRFKDVARSEMKKYGIPASITLAQGLIESNAGESSLSRKNNNHFGIKCFSRRCRKGHCSNFTDDSHKDFFRAYKTCWESFRAHSLLLKNGKRYKKLFRLHSDDYEGWARGLKSAGYATDKGYAQKLIHIIEELELYKYDLLEK